MLPYKRLISSIEKENSLSKAPAAFVRGQLSFQYRGSFKTDVTYGVLEVK